ncbi:MAG: SUMF1/EgtB/PvdO family nonheme iron enzyme [Saprospiraceae bacterium]|jgi:sulfatase modifying factor 1|nr:SUMF1/EgtB/PvdO family nonheme iron enzyme [Saprospiraceae bacterium]
MTLHHIQQLIAEGNTEAAIKTFLRLVEAGEGRNRQVRDDLLVLSGQLEELQRKETLGLIDDKDSMRQHAVVNHAVLQLMERLESGRDVPAASAHKESVANQAPASKTRLYQQIGYAVGIAAVLAVVIYAILHRGGETAAPESAPWEKILKIPPGGYSGRIQDTVFVEGALYEMGSATGEEDEHPHAVVVNSFYMDKHEVTNEQYAAFLNAAAKRDSLWIDLEATYKQERCRIFFSSGKYQVEEGYQKHPVINVRFAGAQMYARYYGMRLPTEAEWEFAARGGKKTKGYAFAGSDSVGRVAWYPGNAQGKLHAVQTKVPNELGLSDMSGNVYEWCSDYYNAQFYFTHIRENPQCVAESKYRVVRGGNVFLAPEFARIANRGLFDPNTPSPGVGFRCVRDKAN